MIYLNLVINNYLVTNKKYNIYSLFLLVFIFHLISFTKVLAPVLYIGYINE